MTVHEIYYKNIFKDFPELFKSYSYSLEGSDRIVNIVQFFEVIYNLFSKVVAVNSLGQS